MGTPAEKLNKSDHPSLIQRINEGDSGAFEKLFYRYYSDLCSLAFKITKCPDQARDVVQDVFLQIWRKRQKWQVKTSLKGYLYQAVWNQALNHKAGKQSRRNLKEQFANDSPRRPEHETVDTSDRTHRLVTEIWQIVESMADRRKFVFTLHRRHGLSYKEIAQVMDVSRKTVENHMGLALKEIREKIDPFLLREQ